MRDAGGQLLALTLERDTKVVLRASTAGVDLRHVLMWIANDKGRYWGLARTGVDRPPSSFEKNVTFT